MDTLLVTANPPVTLYKALHLAVGEAFISVFLFTFHLLSSRRSSLGHQDQLLIANS
jgi:hypothetical protein